MSKVIDATGKVKEVKNLGWLLKNWKEVERFECIRMEQMTGYLVAHLKDGRRYETDFASYCVMLNFLNRPVFHTLPVKVGNTDTEVGSAQYEMQRLNPYVKLL